MMRPVIALDFDDVLMHFNAGFIEFHNRMHGTKIIYDDVRSYDMSQVYGCPTDVINGRVKAFYCSADHAQTEPIPGAVDAVKHLRKRYLLDIVTSRPEVFRDYTQSWVSTFFPDTFRALHFTNGFAATNGVQIRHKSEVCAEIGAAVLIEDALKHAEDVARKGIPVLLPDRPWNRDDTPEGVIRVTSWDEIVSWIEANT
jgi:5'(3')-deoxyribonucleotidase